MRPFLSHATDEELSAGIPGSFTLLAGFWVLLGMVRS
jgi:hypothetical protein